ncbi:MAG: site-specific tyrosine recombinase XerD, partial [Calditrichaeota bacterium]
MNWDKLLERFIRQLALEKGLADNTLFAYRNDLSRYIDYLKEQHIDQVEQITPLLMQNYIGLLYDIGLSSNSMARNFSAIRSFHRYLIMNNLCEGDPSELLETPRRKRKL